MAWEEWERLPWRFGWKHEYWDGHAHLTPRQDHVHVRVGIGARRLPVTPPRLSPRPVEPNDGRGLVLAFIEAFEDGVEFCDWPEEKIHEHAQANIADYFAGRRGTPLLASSRLAFGEGGYVAGAALIAGREAGPFLDLLMVRPGFRRRGVANTLVGAAVEELHAQGATVILRSAHSVSNEESTCWHRAFGFEEDRTSTSRACAGHSTPTRWRDTKGRRRPKRDANAPASRRCTSSGAAAPKSSKRSPSAKASRR